MPLSNNISSDINWRNIDDDETWELIRKNPETKILVQTVAGYSIGIADYIEDWSGVAVFSTKHEKILRIAFL